jgi:hypothetical protein
MKALQSFATSITPSGLLDPEDEETTVLCNVDNSFRTA